ncbi:MAG: hypothetical protein JO081_14495 [Alphaproteobacteria bacterium]|nr:hypothetical protein [Alphaproteobacteria bacterium]
MNGLLRAACGAPLRRLSQVRRQGCRQCPAVALALRRRGTIFAAAIMLWVAPVCAAPDCSAGTDRIDPRCYGAVGDGVHDDATALQQAINAAVAANRPLHLPHAHFVTTRGLNIDYGAGPTQGHEGFLLESEGATIDGTRAGATNVLTIACSGGTPEAPKGCFYFHQIGTLFVNGDTPYWVLVVGAASLADAQNSIAFDHIVVNNSGAGGGAWLNYVLSSHFNIVADTSGNAGGLSLGQVQMSTLQVAASATHGSALYIAPAYNFGNVITAPDLEASPTCVAAAGGSAHDITLTGGTIDCSTAFVDPAHVLEASGFNIGGNVRSGTTP